MNTRNILHKLFICLLLVLTSVSCVDDNLIDNNGVVEGVPVTVKMKLAGTPSDNIVVSTRATGSDLSDLFEIVLCVFHNEDGSFEQIVTNYNSNSLEINSNYVGSNGERYYDVSFTTTSGSKKLIAMANVADGAYWENLINLISDSYNNKDSFDEVKAKIVELNNDLIASAATTEGMQPFHITAPSQMFISGWNQEVIFDKNGSVTSNGLYGGDKNGVAVKMNRAMAHITFNIDENPEGKNGTFTPTSYRVYNIPTRSYLTNDLQGRSSCKFTSNIENIQYIHTASENIGIAQGGSFSFDFYMPENIQQAQQVCNSYVDRDKWEKNDNLGATPENKQWLYAPLNSTFVVISGTYEGEATIEENLNQDVTANVEYTIHLGDFGESGDNNRDYSDFSVKRNVDYTYNVKVLGVDNIVVEAKTNEENQSGAEGSVYDNTSTMYNYNLDAHYEQVFLEYDLSKIAKNLKTGLQGQDLDDAIADQLILIIQSEAMDYNHNYSDIEPYETRNKRGTLSPYQIYADAVRDGVEPNSAKEAVLNGEGEGFVPKKGFDYKWIEFLPQDGTNISAYPGISTWAMEDLEGMKNSDFYAGATGAASSNGDPENLIDVYDMIVEMGKAIKAIYQSDNPSFTDTKIIIKKIGDSYVARFTAFVNEYFYLRHPLTRAAADVWSVIVNKIPREMIIAMSTETSDDGNSSYSKIHSYISQLSMQTFYNDRVDKLNAFGMETYNETPISFKFGTPYSSSNLTSNNGRENQKKMIGVNNRSNLNWTDFIKSNNGWIKSIGSDYKNHKLDGQNGTDAYVSDEAYSACLSRNRDLNGNGKIDENEIRWFLPSLNEYIRMGIGANVVSNAARLYLGDKSLMNDGSYPENYVEDGALYYTSSGTNERLYWAVEKGAYSSDAYATNSGKPIKCIRILPASIEDKNQDISTINGIISDATFEDIESTSNRPRILKFQNRLVPALYRQYSQGALSKHTEDNDANKFYDAIYVADSDLDRTAQLQNLNGYSLLLNPCSSYTEKGVANWRLPNLVELSAMNAAGVFKDGEYAYGNGTQVASCTLFSNINVRVGFAYNGLVTCPSSNALAWYFKIRCVKDVPESQIPNTGNN